MKFPSDADCICMCLSIPWIYDWRYTQQIYTYIHNYIIILCIYIYYIMIWIDMIYVIYSCYLNLAVQNAGRQTCNKSPGTNGITSAIEATTMETHRPGTWMYTTGIASKLHFKQRQNRNVITENCWTGMNKNQLPCCTCRAMFLGGCNTQIDKNRYTRT